LHPGQTLLWHNFYRHDEGWSSESRQWALNGGEISEEIISDGTDCDGRLTRYATFIARVEDIDSRKRPDWTEQSASQRDYQAEAAGY
jgi:hypothetical protein